MTGAAITCIALGLLAIARLRGMLAQLEHEHRRMRGAMRDPVTGTLCELAIPVTLAPELAHAVTAAIPAALVVFRIHGEDPVAALTRLARAARVHETVFRSSDREATLLLWGVDEDRAARAVHRLGSALLGPDLRVVDAGVAFIPRNARDVESALAFARDVRRPLQEFTAYCADFPFSGARTT